MASADPLILMPPSAQPAQTPQSIDTISALQHYELVRKQIEHEDNLIGQRVSWFVAGQSFLFSAYAIVISNLKPTLAPWVNAQQHLLFSAIPVLAAVTCVLSYGTVVAGIRAMANLRGGYEQWLANRNLRHPDELPPVQGVRQTQVLGQAGPVLLPPVFLVVWVVLLIHGMR